MKNKAVSIVILVITLLLAGVAIFTAVRLYQLRQESVAPTAPESEPAAAAPESCSSLSFTIGEPTDTPTNTITTTPTVKDCAQSCAASSECKSGLICSNGSCRNPSCSAETDCVCPTATTTTTTTPTATSTVTSTITATATSTSTVTSTITPTATLPEAGIPAPTVFGISFGVLLLIIAVALAL